MLVKNWMSKNVITIGEEDSMQQAATLMREHRIRMLPVMGKGELVGVVSDTDLKRASASGATMLDIHELLYLISKIKISDIMTRNPITVPYDYTVEEAAQLLMERNISGVPVVDCDGKLVGIITRNDLFKILISLSGLGKKGIQFAFLTDDKPGSIKNLADVIRNHEGRIASILSTDEYAPEGKRIVYFRIYDIDRSIMPDLIRELGEKGTLIYLVDHRDNKRQIFLDMKA
ncbi:MAG: CBS and ACT domain-containing protein [Syntrophobacteraceae bacterium]|jgi:acetoin utilization protein AcuB